jgi:hypothetical protein
MANDSRPTSRTMTDAQREYERKRAQKAGMSLDQKQKQATAAAPKTPKVERKPGLLSRLIDKAHEPLKKKT